MTHAGTLSTTSRPRPTPLPLPASRGYLRLIRFSAWYDIVITTAFATPWTFAVLYRQLNAAAQLTGASPLPEFDSVHVLFVNLAGSVVLMWAAVRLWRTQAIHGLCDGIVRGLFALWQGFALLQGASALVWPFLIAEIGFFITQLAPIVLRVVRPKPTDDALPPVPRHPPAQPLETALIAWFRAALAKDFPTLASRMGAARVARREFTAGAGALCQLESDFDGLAGVELLSHRVDGPVIRSPDIAGDAWVTLQVLDGIPHSLEIWAPGTDYPIERHPKVFALVEWDGGDEPMRRALTE
jgi:hypothetical protein